MQIYAVLPDDDWITTHLVSSLEKTADRLFTFFYPGLAGWHKGGWLKTRREKGAELLADLDRTASRTSLDLLFMMVYDDFLTPALAGKIKTFGIPIINYHVDMPTQWYRVLRTTRYYDVLAVSHRDFSDHLARLTNVAFVPMAANPDYYRPLNGVTKQYDVLFMGGQTPERARVMAAVSEVTQNGIVFGGNWHSAPAANRLPPTRRVKYPVEKYVNDICYYLVPRLRVEGARRILAGKFSARRPVAVRYNGKIGGYLPDGDVVEAIAKAKIVLGINQRFGRIGSSRGYVCGRLRDFEIPACGAFYLVQRYPDLALYFREGEEIEGWSSLDELQRKVAYFLEHDELRETTARRARERVLKCHTWEHRFAQMTQQLRSKTAPQDDLEEVNTDGPTV